jgi:phosphoribosylamine--glycine ligase
VVEVPANVPAGVTVFLSAVDVRDGQLVATGSRTVAVVGVGKSLAEAEALCEGVVREIPGPFFHRADIGTAVAIERRVEHMKAVRAV